MYNDNDLAKSMLIHLGKLRVSSIAESIALNEKLMCMFASTLDRALSKSYGSFENMSILVNHIHYLEIATVGSVEISRIVFKKSRTSSYEHIHELIVLIDIFKKYIHSLTLHNLIYLGVNF